MKKSFALIMPILMAMVCNIADTEDTPRTRISKAMWQCEIIGN